MTLLFFYSIRQMPGLQNGSFGGENFEKMQFDPQLSTKE